ncbi:MAG: hypothetical protein KDB27_27420, partial [Planctomycetales bacterium]|nr:hypothetical protein [Planctomycetales bacterium]
MQEDCSDSPNEAADDRNLLEQYRDGKIDAATELYLRYANRLQALTDRQTSKAFASRFDPEDVVQSVFRTFFRRVSDGMYDVPPGEELWNLLLVLALNKIRTLGKHHRAQKRDVSATVEINDNDSTKNYDDNSYRALKMAIDEMLGDMTDYKRAIIELRIQGN